MRRVVLLGVLVLGCSDRPVDEVGEGADELGSDTATQTEDEASEGDTLGVDGETGETGEPTCYPLHCLDTCMNMSDECGELMSGTCSDAGECVCEVVSDCQPCLEETCGPYEECWGDWSLAGECDFSCYYEFEFAWDAELGCTIVLPTDIPDFVFNSFFLDIDDMWHPRLETCDDPRMQDGWVFDTRAMTIELCPQACSAFEAGGLVTTGWGFPCE